MENNFEGMTKDELKAKIKNLELDLEDTIDERDMLMCTSGQHTSASKVAAIAKEYKEQVEELETAISQAKTALKMLA